MDYRKIQFAPYTYTSSNDEKDYFDGKTIFPEEFYDVLRSGKDIKTYHINSVMFYENFYHMLRMGMK